MSFNQLMHGAVAALGWASGGEGAAIATQTYKQNAMPWLVRFENDREQQSGVGVELTLGTTSTEGDIAWLHKAGVRIEVDRKSYASTEQFLADFDDHVSVDFDLTIIVNGVGYTPESFQTFAAGHRFGRTSFRWHRLLDGEYLVEPVRVLNRAGAVPVLNPVEMLRQNSQPRRSIPIRPTP